MTVFTWLALCGVLFNSGDHHPTCSHGRVHAQKVSATVGVPVLTIGASQREAVRAAAAAYRGSAAVILLHRPTSSEQMFAEGLAAALRSAGLAVDQRIEETTAPSDCPDRPGLRVRYGAIRSGAVNAIAEALIRSRVLSNSLTGCRVANDDELTFIVSSGAS